MSRPENSNICIFRKCIVSNIASFNQSDDPGQIKQRITAIITFMK